MRNPSPILALLTLAAAASAQTLTFSPVATRGFSHGESQRYGSYAGFQSALQTGYDFTNGMGTPYGASTDAQGWRTEFDLSRMPAGSRIVSATLTTRVIAAYNAFGLPVFQDVLVAKYVGNGTIPLSSPDLARVASLSARLGTMVSLDVADVLRTATGRYQGFNFRTDTNALLSSLTWSAPTLTVTYAPGP